MRAIPVINGFKVCTVCGELKDTKEDFYFIRGRARATCKFCSVERSKKYYYTNKEAISAYKKAWWVARKAKGL